MIEVIDKGKANQNQDWLKRNLDNEEGVLQFLDDPNNSLED
jgi:hypothetical protein